jgi:NADH-quinone oxidoreductase subunit E
MQKQAEPEGKVRVPEPPEDEIQSFLDKLAVGRQSNLIAVLQQVQARFGYLPVCALRRISQRTRVPLSRIYGVLSFYAQFYTEPHGQHTVRCCRGTACHVKGAGRVLNAVEEELGIGEGQTTPDFAFYLETVACLGTCFLAPAMMIDNLYFGRLTRGRVQSILRSYRSGKP